MRPRVLAVLLALGVLAAACSSGGGGDEASPSSTSAPATSAPARSAWRVQQAEDHVTIDTGGFRLVAQTTPRFRLHATIGDSTFFADDRGLFIDRGAERTYVGAVTDTAVADRKVTFVVAFADDTTGTVEIASEGAHGVAVRVTPDDPEGVTGWGSAVATPDDELIYGLTERIVDNGRDSELFPAEVGSLDRKGEKVTMYVTPTISGYAPFYQSSRGYGLLVDGFMPGAYDVGATDPNVLEFAFELDPDAAAGEYHLMYGPDHAAILEQYYSLTAAPVQPPDSVFLHWRGRDENRSGPTADVGGVAINADVASDLDAYKKHGIPAGIYHFDRPWAVGQEGFGEFTFDPVRYPNAEKMLGLMQEQGWHLDVWMAPWAIGARGEEAKAKGYLAPNSPRAIDLTDPDAVAWLKQGVLAFLAGPEGSHVDGFFLDRGDEPDVSSTAADIYADGRNGRQIHNWYPVEYERIFRDVIDEARPDTGFLIARPGYTGSQAYVMRWGGDTHSRDGLAIPETPEEDAPSTDLGLRSVLISVQRAAFMGTPYWGSDIGGYNAWSDREVYARWIEVGFASPLMRFHGQGGTPWRTTSGEFDQGLLDIYKRYVVLRHGMNDYLSGAAAEAAKTGEPMARPLVFGWPDEKGALDRWDEWMLGDDLLVAPVWKSGSRERTVWIPPGRWVPFWDRSRVVTGPREITVDAPLDELPMWVRPGSPLLDLEVD